MSEAWSGLLQVDSQPVQVVPPPESELTPVQSSFVTLDLSGDVTLGGADAQFNAELTLVGFFNHPCKRGSLFLVAAAPTQVPMYWTGLERA